jgi:nitroreductase
MVVTDPAKRAGLGDLYRQAFYARYTAEYRAEHQQTDPRARASFVYLADHLHEVPVLIIPCVETRFPPAGLYGSILPAAWSLMLALRARGLGAAWTSIHIARYEKEAAALLGIPDQITQAALLPVAYYTGTDFKPAKRLSARERTYWDTWGQKH